MLGIFLVVFLISILITVYIRPFFSLILHIMQHLLILVFLCGSQSLFHFNLRPSETFSFLMRPVNCLKFETPVLNRRLLPLPTCPFQLREHFIKVPHEIDNAITRPIKIF